MCHQVLRAGNEVGEGVLLLRAGRQGCRGRQERCKQVAWVAGRVARWVRKGGVGAFVHARHWWRLAGGCGGHRRQSCCCACSVARLPPLHCTGVQTLRYFPSSYQVRPISPAAAALGLDFDEWCMCCLHVERWAVKSKRLLVTQPISTPAGSSTADAAPAAAAGRRPTHQPTNPPTHPPTHLRRGRARWQR